MELMRRKHSINLSSRPQRAARRAGTQNGEAINRCAGSRINARAFSGMTVILLWFFCVLPSHAQELHPLTPHPEGVAWPTDGWEYGELPAETAALVQPLIDRAMASEKPDAMGETRAIVIVHGGKIVFETYREGFTKDTKQLSWSMAKSVTSALVGRAVYVGMIESIDDPMPTPFPDGDPRADISWRHWLNMTEGLDYHEISDVPLQENDIAQMLFGRGRYDVVQYMVDELPPQDTPGEIWKYSTAGYHMIGKALQDLINPTGGTLQEFNEEKWQEATKFIIKRNSERLSTDKVSLMKSQFEYRNEWSLRDKYAYLRAAPIVGFANTNLFDFMGGRARPEFDAAGTYLGGSNVWASAHDYAKFGYLYLRDGVWEGERLLPEGWVDFSRTKTTGTNNNTYGAGFWITAYGEEPTTDQAPRTPPWDAFNANGSEGQTIWIVPSRDLVIVRTGQMANTMENWNMLFEWCQEIARAFPEVQD